MLEGKHAIDVLKQSLKITKIVYGEDHPDIAIILIGLSSHYHDLGDILNAKTIAQDALRLLRDTYSPFSKWDSFQHCSSIKITTMCAIFIDEYLILPNLPVLVSNGIYIYLHPKMLTKVSSKYLTLTFRRSNIRCTIVLWTNNMHIKCEVKAYLLVSIN